MATPLTRLEQRHNEDWLIGFDCQKLAAIAHRTLQNLAQWPASAPPTLFLSESDPWHFLAYFIAACSSPCTVVLGNPTWTETEWHQAIELTKPDLILSQTVGKQQAADNRQSAAPLHLLSPAHPLPLILIPTGGSSGTLRFAMHTWDTLTASVSGFQQHFQVERVNSLCVLPLYHVSGLMQFMRSFLSGGKLAIVPFKSLQAGDYPALPTEHFFLSLVPTQLQRLLQAGADQEQAAAEGWGHGRIFSAPSPLSPSPHLTILLGGAPAWAELLESARNHNLPIAPTYGMTETAAQIATLKPAEFLQGRSGCGRVLPHAQVTIRAASGQELPPNQVGRVAIAAKSLMLGYFPQVSTKAELLTADLGFLDEAGYLHILGRADGAIISGGENVFPAEVEAAIWQTGLVIDVCVVGLTDPEWGQIVTAVYVPAQTATVEEIKAAIAPTLCRYKQPKHWVAVAALPRNAQGKINRQQVLALLTAPFPNSPTTST